MAGIINVFLDAIEGYELLVVAVVVVIGYFGYTKWKKRKKKTKTKDTKKPEEAGNSKKEENDFQIQNQPPNPISNMDHGFENLSEFEKFVVSEKEKDKDKEQDVVEEIKHVNTIMKEKSNVIDVNMSEDFARLKKQLDEVNFRKNQIKDYGKELAHLYKKHVEREYHLTLMLNEIEHMMKQQNQLAQNRNFK